MKVTLLCVSCYRMETAWLPRFFGPDTEIEGRCSRCVTIEISLDEFVRRAEEVNG